MNRILERIWHSKHSQYILPLIFCIGNLVNICFFYLGLAYEDNPARKIGFIIVNLVFAVITFVALAAVLRFGKLRMRSLFPLGAVLLIYFVYYAVALSKFGLTSNWIHNAEQFLGFSLPAFCAGIYAAQKQNEETLLDCLERLSVWAVPAALIYINAALFNCNPFNDGRDLGVIDYMAFSYTLMPFLLAIMLQFIENKPLRLFGREIKHSRWMRALLMAIFWIAIIASGTRGTYFCVIGFCVFALLSAFLHRRNRRITAAVSAAMILLLCFNIFIYAPKGFHTDRMSFFLDGLKNGELTTSSKNEEIDNRLEELVKIDGGQLVANNDGDGKDGTNLKITDRGELYKLAWMEFQKSPITGMDPMGYSVKYGIYPHNAVLQLLCETGGVGFLLFMTMILWAVIRILRCCRRRREARALLLLFIAYAIQANISGDFWTCPLLLCALGYGLALPQAENVSTGAV